MFYLLIQSILKNPFFSNNGLTIPIYGIWKMINSSAPKDLWIWRSIQEIVNLDAHNMVESLLSFGIKFFKSTWENSTTWHKWLRWMPPWVYLMTITQLIGLDLMIHFQHLLKKLWKEWKLSRSQSRKTTLINAKRNYFKNGSTSILSRPIDRQFSFLIA